MSDVQPVTDADSALLNISSIVQVEPPFVDNVDAFPPTESSGRLNQQQFLPAAVQSRLLGSILSSSPNSTALGTGNSSGKVIIPNSTSSIFTLTVSNNQGRIIIAVPDISIFINGRGAANLWPNSDYAMGNFPITTYNSWGLTNNKNVVTQLVARNNSGADVTAEVIVRWRIITDPATTPTNRKNS